MSRKKGSSIYNPRSFYKKSSYNVWCAVCAGIVKRSEARFRWDGPIVCNKCWDPKHPQLETVKTPRSESSSPKDARAWTEDTFGEGNINDL